MCGVEAKHHPQHVPKRMRGQGFCCVHGAAFRDDAWLSHVDLLLERVSKLDKDHKLRKGFVQRGLVDPHLPGSV